jgi:glutamate N-acetyltransferase/amino-acid N-acetyltransferase
MKIINAGVTAPKGFKCAGLRAGVKPGKTNKDMAMIVSEVPAKIAGTFTKNIVKAAPVLWGKKIVEEQEVVRAVVVNTGIANACTGAQGYENVVTEAKEVAALLDIKPEEVVVGSTGVIGQQLPMDVIKEGIKKLVPELKADRQSEEDASWAILTTDTKPKEAAVEVEIAGKTVTIAGMCKGSGMIHPNMGTMLGFITTDAAIDKALLLELQRELIEDTFNMVSVDGDTSTNDTVFVLANGMAENKEIKEKDADYEAFKEGLLYVNQSLAKQIAGDGEGCTRLFEVHVAGADSKENAKILSKSVVTSSLTKAAIYGKDANWGRILCALGYAGVDFDPVKVDISLKSADGVIEIVKDGIATDYSEDEATKVLSADAVTADINVHNGDFEATAWGCDLTHDYVTINADYRS